MNAHLMFKDRDTGLQVTYSVREGFVLSGPDVPSNADELIQDLELQTVLLGMANRDNFLYNIAAYELLASLHDPEEILYRQQILDDTIARPDIIREVYQIAVEAIVREIKIYRRTMSGVSGILHDSVERVDLFVELLQRLRKIAEDHGDEFRSEGLRTFFAMLKTNLDDAYFASVTRHLKILQFKDGTLLSAELGKGNRGIRYVLHIPQHIKRRWKERIGMAPHTSYSFELHPRDEAGFMALGELENRGVNLVANALAQSTDHIFSFFKMLAVETGFYVGCCNLHDRLLAKNEPVCMPVPVPWNLTALSFQGLYDVSLTLRSEQQRVVGNSANGDDKPLVIITGANSGGKSTILRSIGQAQLMMQSGMFVGAGSFRASVCNGLFTHFIREEDTSMASGKLDEELARMSSIADQLQPHTIVLFNESFAATNEREGAEIGRQIVNALLESDIKPFFVTHQFTLANTFYRQRRDSTLFLRAEREQDGRRNFRLIEAAPLPTSYGEDLYKRIGGWSEDQVPVVAPSAIPPEPANPEGAR